MEQSRMPLEFVFGAGDTVITQTMNVNGWIKALAIHTPDFTNVVTATVTMDDPVGFNSHIVNLYTGTAINKNTKSPILGADITAAEKCAIPADAKYTVTVTLSGVPGGAGGTVFVALYLAH